MGADMGIFEPLTSGRLSTQQNCSQDALRAISQAITKSCVSHVHLQRAAHYLPQWVKPLGQVIYDLVVILYDTKSKLLSTYGNADDNTLTLH